MLETKIVCRGYCVPRSEQQIGQRPMAPLLYVSFVFCKVYGPPPCKVQRQATRARPVRVRNTMSKIIHPVTNDDVPHSESKSWFMNDSKMAADITEAI